MTALSKVLAIIVVSWSLATFGCLKEENIGRPTSICYNTHCFSLEFANTPESRRLGLMNRASLPTDSGMLFIFPSPKIAKFWMKDTLIPLDIIWMNQQLKVVHIKHNATPLSTESIIPPTPAKYVLEINAGIATAMGLKVGDQFEFR